MVPMRRGQPLPPVRAALLVESLADVAVRPGVVIRFEAVLQGADPLQELPYGRAGRRSFLVPLPLQRGVPSKFRELPR